MELMKAYRQWAERPADQRFWTLEEMLTATRINKTNAVVGKAALQDLIFTPGEMNHGLFLKGLTGRLSTLSHFAFGQVSRLLGAPADYLRTLPTETVASALNHGIHNFENKDRQMDLLLSKGSTHLHCRAATSDKYARIWGCDIVEKVMPLTAMGWNAPPARTAGVKGERTRQATKADVLKMSSKTGMGIQIREGDLIAPAGLYASDKDMFIFMVNEAKPIDGGKGVQLGRGFFLENSEVGDRAFKITTFLYNAVCGNHIVWGASDVNEVSIIHRGEANDRAYGELQVKLKQYADDSVSELEGKIKKAKTFMLGTTKDELLSNLFSKRIPNLTKGEIEGSYEEAVAHPEDHAGASPASVWGFVNGMTRLSQKTEHTDSRVRLDRTAGRVMEMAF